MPGKIVEVNGRRFLVWNEDICEIQPASEEQLARFLAALNEDVPEPIRHDIISHDTGA